MWYTVLSHTRSYLRLGAVCHLLCLWWYQKQDPEKCNVCEMESAEEEKNNPTCAWLRQSPSAPGSYKLCCIFAEALLPQKSSLIDWPPMAAGKWPMCVPVHSTQPTNPSMPLHTKAEAEKNTDDKLTTAKVTTVTQTAVVHTVTMIVMVMQQICTDYWKSVVSLGGGVGCYKMFTWKITLHLSFWLIWCPIHYISWFFENDRQPPSWI